MDAFDVMVVVAATSSRGRHILFRHPIMPLSTSTMSDTPLRWSEQPLFGVNHRILAHLLTPTSPQMCDTRFQIALDNTVFLGIPSPLGVESGGSGHHASASMDARIQKTRRRSSLEALRIDTSASKMSNNMSKSSNEGASGSSERIVSVPATNPMPVATPSRVLVEDTFRDSTATPSSASSSRSASIGPPQIGYFADIAAQDTKSLPTTPTGRTSPKTRLSVLRPHPLNLSSSLSSHALLPSRRRGHHRSVSAAPTPTMPNASSSFNAGSHLSPLGLVHTEPEEVVQTGHSMSRPSTPNITTSHFSPPVRSVTPRRTAPNRSPSQLQHPWHVSMFHFCLVVQPKSSIASSTLPPQSFLDKLYRRIVRPLTFALMQEQHRCDYVKREVISVLKLLEDLQAKVMKNPKTMLEEIHQAVLDASGLMRDLAYVRDALVESIQGQSGTTGPIWLRVNRTLPLLLHPVTPIPVARLRTGLAQSTLSHQKLIAVVRPYHACLLLHDQNELLRRVEIQSHPQMVSLIDHISPVMTLSQVSQSIGWAVEDVISIVKVWVQWGMAKVIDIVSDRAKVEHLREEFGKRFSPFDMYGMLSAFSFVPESRRSRMPVNNETGSEDDEPQVKTRAMAVSSTPPHPYLLEILQRRPRSDTSRSLHPYDGSASRYHSNQQYHGTYLEAVVFLLAHDVIRPINTYVLLLVPNRVRDPESWTGGDMDGMGAGTTTPGWAGTTGTRTMATASVRMENALPGIDEMANETTPSEPSTAAAAFSRVQQGVSSTMNVFHPDDETVLVSPSWEAACDAEREYLQNLTLGHPRDVVTRFWKLVWMWDGVTCIEEMVWLSGMSRRDVVDVINRFRTEIVTLVY